MLFVCVYIYIHIYIRCSSCFVICLLYAVKHVRDLYDMGVNQTCTRIVASHLPEFTHHEPMKSDPPTPTRAPDNQFRQIQYRLLFNKKHQFTQFLGLGSGGSYSVGESCVLALSFYSLLTSPTELAILYYILNTYYTILYYTILYYTIL